MEINFYSMVIILVSMCLIYIFFRFVGRILLQMFAANGNVFSQALLGCCFYEGRLGFSKDDAMACKWFSQAAERGEAIAQYNLGMCYCQGLGVSQNLVEGYAWRNCAIALGEALWEKETLEGMEQELTIEEIEKVKKRTSELLDNMKSR